MTVSDKPTIPDVLKLLKPYIAKNLAGGSLHIVLDDKNLDESSIEFCAEYAKTNQDSEGQQLAEMLLRCSKTQRNKISKIYDTL